MSATCQWVDSKCGPVAIDLRCKTLLAGHVCDPLEPHGFPLRSGEAATGAGLSEREGSFSVSQPAAVRLHHSSPAKAKDRVSCLLPIEI